MTRTSRRSAAIPSPGRFRRGILRIDDAAAGVILPIQHPVDDPGGASDTGLDGHGADGAISAAGPAFHTGIAIPDADPFLIEEQYLVGADLRTRAAPRTQLRVDPQGDYVLQIDETLHAILLRKSVRPAERQIRKCRRRFPAVRPTAFLFSRPTGTCTSRRR